MSISEILYALNFWKNVVISRQLSRTLKCSGAEMNSFFFKISVSDTTYLLPPMFIIKVSCCIFSRELQYVGSILLFFSLDKTSLVLCLLYKMDQFLNNFAKLLPFNSILLQLQMCCFLKRTFICSTDCQEDNKPILLISFQFVIFSRLLSRI